MKKTLLIISVILFVFKINAQSDFWPSNPINTGSNATYLVQNVSFMDNGLTGGKIGAFFINDNNELQCGGWENWSGQTTSIAAWANDETTDNKDGFTAGEEITWLASNDGGITTYQVSVEYSMGPTGMGTSIFAANSVNIISVFTISNSLFCINDSNEDGVCDELEVFGCIDSLACNYESTATNSDSSCVFAETYYDCNGVCLSDTDADGVCDELEVSGCMDILACNYDSTATNSGDCTYAAAYYDCSGACINDADGDNVCDELEIIGCTDSLACNYDSTATDSDSTCVFAETYYDCSGVCLNDTDGDEVCDEIDNCIDISNIDQVDSDNDGEGDECDYDDNIGIEQVEDAAPQLIKMIDILGREQKEHKLGTLLIYIYNDGTTEKIIK